MIRINHKESHSLGQDTKASFQEAKAMASLAGLLHSLVDHALLKVTAAERQLHSISQRRKFFLNRNVLERYIKLLLSRFLGDQHNFDAERPATSHKYGCSTITKATSNLNDPCWTTTTRLSFRKPEDRTKPNQRTKEIGKTAVFDAAMTRSTRPETKASGFVTSFTFFDGTGWEPDKNLHTDQIRTSYRNTMCKPKPFHK